MKCFLLVLSVVFSSQCLAGSERLEYAKSWLNTWLPETMEFNLASSGVKFYGCKQKEYQLNLIQPLSENLTVESAISYAKGRLSWGVFSQKISLHEFSFVPRYQLSHQLSLGFGVINQTAIEFTSTVGSEYDLSSNTEWLISARTAGFAQRHTLELTLSQQRWQATQASGNWYQTGAANSKINLSYTGYF